MENGFLWEIYFQKKTCKADEDLSCGERHTHTNPMNTPPPIDRATAAWFVAFALIAGLGFGWFLLSYLTEPDPFLSRGTQTEESK